MAPKEEGKLEVNKQYQEAIKIVINLVTASLVLPVVFLKNIVGGEFNKISGPLAWCAYVSWGLLGLSLGACVAFYVCSTKYTKALYELYKDDNENQKQQKEHWRDAWAWIATPTALLGLIFLLVFLLEAGEARG